jgi:hypothetical protein
MSLLYHGADTFEAFTGDTQKPPKDNPKITKEVAKKIEAILKKIAGKSS